MFIFFNRILSVNYNTEHMDLSPKYQNSFSLWLTLLKNLPGALLVCLLWTRHKTRKLFARPSGGAPFTMKKIGLMVMAVDGYMGQWIDNSVTVAGFS